MWQFRETLGEVPVFDDVLSSHELEIYPTTSFDEKFIEFEFQRDWNYYVELRQTYLALKLKTFKGRGYETYSSKEVKKDHKEEAKVYEPLEEEEESPVPPVIHP